MDHQHLVYTNEKAHKARAYIIACLSALVLIGIGIVASFFHRDGWMIGIFFLVAIIFGWFIYIFYQAKPKDTYRYELREDGLFQQWNGDEEGEIFMPFAEMDLVLVGMFERRMALPRGGHMYQYKALLIIRCAGEYFFKAFSREATWRAWANQLEGKVPHMQYTTMNIGNAFDARHDVPIDFSQVPASEEDIVSPHIGAESYTPLLEDWEPEGVVRSYGQHVLLRTRKAEKISCWVLFVYNFLFAWLVFPVVPIENGESMHLTETVLVVYVGVNVLIPVVFVFWRTFTRPLLPVVFAGVAVSGNIIGLLLATSMHDFSFSYLSLFVLNALTLMLWFVSMVKMKVWKLIRVFVRDWEFGQ